MHTTAPIPLYGRVQSTDMYTTAPVVREGTDMLNAITLIVRANATLIVRAVWPTDNISESLSDNYDVFRPAASSTVRFSFFPLLSFLPPLLISIPPSRSSFSSHPVSRVVFETI